jgi:hypothetical protein
MTTRSWIRKQFATHAAGTLRKAPARFRPCVEILEDRLAPATVPIPTNPTFMSITSISAVLGGTITAANNGGLGIQIRGVVYSTTANTDSGLQIGKPGVTEVDAPANLANGAFMVTVGPLTPNTTYYFRAFATNGTLPANNDFQTGYTSVTTFKTTPGSAQDNRILMPSNTVTVSGPTDYKNLNKVLFFQPTPGETWTTSDGKTFTIPQIPAKQITFTNNLTTTVYPFMRDAAATIDPTAKSQGLFQGLYDPIDQLNEEYRGYIGYQLNGVDYLGLLPGMSISIDVPLAFWDGARCEIAADGTYLVNNFKVVNPNEDTNPAPNPFQYYDKNTDGSPTARVALPAVSIGNAPAGVTEGMVMWYRQGLSQADRKTEPPQQAHAPASDSPSQLIEWTMRDPVLSTLNPNIDLLKPNFGETHALINYDVSYVDNMALPVAMEALDVPIPITEPPQKTVQIPFPGPRLPYGYVGAALSLPAFQTAVDSILTSGLGQYFGGKGWPQYYFPANRFPGGIPQKIPSGQDALSDSPFVNHTTSYDAPITNHYLLTSGGTTPIQVVAAGLGWSRGTTLYLLADTLALQQNLQSQLQKDMVVKGGNVPVNTTVTVQSINQDDSGKCVFTDFDPGDGVKRKVLQVTLNTSLPDSGTTANNWTFTRSTKDYVSTALINLWYTWAQYYVDHVVVTESPPGGLEGHSLTTDAKMPDNVIKLDSPAPGLKPGMLVTGDASTGIFQLRPDGSGATTILSIDADNETIHLSQAVGVNTGNGPFFYKFTKPTMNSPVMAGFSQDQIIKSVRKK